MTVNGSSSSDDVPMAFVSYAHDNADQVVRLRDFWKPRERNGHYEIWFDEHIYEGEFWKETIKEKLYECDIAILMVTQSFLTSEFILDDELPDVLQRAREEEIEVFPVILEECDWEIEDRIRQFQVFNPEEPLESIQNPSDYRSKAKEMAKKLSKIADRVRRRQSSPTQSAGSESPQEKKVDAETGNTARLFDRRSADGGGADSDFDVNQVDRDAVFQSIIDSVPETKRKLSSSSISTVIDLDDLSRRIGVPSTVDEVSRAVRDVLDSLKEDCLIDYESVQKRGRQAFKIEVLRRQSDRKWDDWAEIYSDVMLTIWLPGVENPIWDFLQDLRSIDPDLCVDFGCGQGQLVERVDSEFPDARVLGVDYSTGMLEKARNRFPEQEFEWADMRDLSDWYQSVDVGFTTNSILPPNPDEAYIMFREVMKSIKEGGYFLGVLPSGDTIEHLMELKKQKHIAEGDSEEEAERKTREYYVDLHKFDPEKGLYADDSDGEHPQKMWWPDEIRENLSIHGFDNVRLEKVYYPWTACRAFGWGYFPDAERVWDWAVCAQKKQ